jgi:RNA polymerase-binding transcription factor DksA
LEASLRQELAKRMKEGPDLFASSVRDEGDLSHFGFEQEISRRRMINCNEKLKEITEALERMNHARFGICEACGDRRKTSAGYTLRRLLPRMPGGPGG